MNYKTPDKMEEMYSNREKIKVGLWTMGFRALIL
jgi:hypothetical protein